MIIVHIFIVFNSQSRKHNQRKRNAWSIGGTHLWMCLWGCSRENWLRVKTPPECSRYPPSYDLDSQTERRGKRREPAEHHKSLLYSLVYRAGRMCNHASCLLWTPQCFLSHDGLYPLKVWTKRDHFSHKLLLSGIRSQGWEKLTRYANLVTINLVIVYKVIE